MIEEFIKEIQELQEYKYKYKCVQADKQTMSELLYEYMKKEYDETPYIDRCQEFHKYCCSACRYDDCCDTKNNLPLNIYEPIKSDKAWIPAKTTCGQFDWR